LPGHLKADSLAMVDWQRKKLIGHIAVFEKSGSRNNNQPEWLRED
jgi:hypothetical protein